MKKRIILKHYTCDAETEYAVLGNNFSFDYAVECGITFITFYDADREAVMEVQSSYEISEFVDFDIINDDDYCISMEDLIVDTVQESIDEYLTNEDEVFDLNIVMAKISHCLTTHYKEFFYKKYQGTDA